jgi:hypothetical protein
MPAGRETEHEVRVETEWQGASEDKSHTRALRQRRTTAWWAESIARQLLCKSQVVAEMSAPADLGGEILNRNGWGGPLRC